MTGACWLIWIAAAGASPAGSIAFVSGTTQDDRRVCVLDAANLTVTPVGPGTGDGAAAWSPDGRWLAFETRRNEGLGIVLARPDGSETKPLAHAKKWNRRPSWSPDSGKLVYCGADDMGFEQRCVVYDLASGAETEWCPELQAIQAVWMPNLNLLRALRPEQEIELKDEQGAMKMMDWAGKGNLLIAIGLKKAKVMSTALCLVADDAVADIDEMLTPKAPYVEWNLAFSPSGNAVAYESNDGGDREIYVLTKNGALNVSNHRAADWDPAWAPKGDWVAFESFRDGRRGIFRAYADTARVVPVVSDPASDNWSPTWSADGKWIAFVSNRSGKPDLWAVDVSKQAVRPLTQAAGFALGPVWQPKVKK